MRHPLGVSETDWLAMTETLQKVYADASRVIENLAIKRRSTARQIAHDACLEPSSVLAALLLLKLLDLVRVRADMDDLAVVLRALPVRCERITDASGHVRWLCVANVIDKAD